MISRKAAAKRRAPATPAGPLDRDAWLAAATDAIADGGFGDARILTLAQRLGVTRGSFYWHFRDHDDFIRSLLERWRDEQLRALASWRARHRRRRSRSAAGGPPAADRHGARRAIAAGRARGAGLRAPQRARRDDHRGRQPGADGAGAGAVRGARPATTSARARSRCCSTRASPAPGSCWPHRRQREDRRDRRPPRPHHRRRGHRAGRGSPPRATVTARRGKIGARNREHGELPIMAATRKTSKAGEGPAGARRRTRGARARRRAADRRSSISRSRCARGPIRSSASPARPRTSRWARRR